MSQSITNYITVAATEENTATTPASFSDSLFVHEHTVDTSKRIHGPFLSSADVLEFGFASGSPPHKYAQSLFAQPSHPRQFYVGRGAGGEAVNTVLDECYAENPGLWYATAMEHRTAAAAKLLAEWHKDKKKIAIAQCNDASMLADPGRTYTATVGGTPADGDYDLIFTGFGLASPVTVKVTRSTTPATNDDLADAIDTALDTAAGGSLDGELVASSITNDGAVVTFKMTDGLALGTVTSAAPGGATLTVTATDPDIATDFFLSQYKRTALFYYSDDAVYADAALLGVGLGFNLDVEKGDWFGKPLVGIAGDTLTNAQVAHLRASNVNYFSPAVMSTGQSTTAFTAQGWFPFGTAGAGRRIDITTSIDWLTARLEEALTNTRLRAPQTIRMNDQGIGQFVAPVYGVFNTAVAAGHVDVRQVPAGEIREGTDTPIVFAPRASELTSAQRASRKLTLSALVYLLQSIETIEFTLETRI